MKGIVFWWVMSFCAVSHAEEMKFEFEKKPRAIHPPGLYQAGISGAVRIAFIAHSDGSITDIKVLRSSYREFAKAAIHAVTRWRVKPWSPTSGRPAMVPVEHEIYFLAKGSDRELIARMRSRVKSLSCARINKEVDYLQQQWPDENLIEIPTFHHTLQLLGLKARRDKSSVAESMAIAGQFKQAIPDILSRCREDSTLGYLALLPEAVRVRL
jgi:TonB family protein